ncbi:unnamed protein product [Candida verbasci]|uniref:Kinesin-like protein n=1 Tax=Candida verbasci TaxID=1227364 RepID=A0A9W4XM90_9ASCO|nr:unnamed protein product [Candida verbasci]
MHDDSNNSNSINTNETTKILKEINPSVINSLNHLKNLQGANHKMRKTTTPSSDLHNYRQLIYEKEREMDQLATQEITLKTEIETQILSNYQIENKQSKLITLINEIELQINELNSYRDNSIEDLNKKFKLQHQEMVVQHTAKLNNLKEEVSNQIESLLGEKHRRYEKELSQLNEEIKELRSEKLKLSEEFNSKLTELKHNHLERKKQKVTEIQKEIDENKLELNQLQVSITTKKQEVENINTYKIPSVEKEHTRFKQILNQLKYKNMDKQNDIDLIKKQIVSTKNRISQLHENAQLRDQNIITMKLDMETMNKNLIEVEALRRKLHSKLQDLKGNIRVFCRLRSVESNELMDYTVVEDELNDDSKQELVLNNQEKNTSYRFSFDKIFNIKHTNDYIFEELSQLIQCSLDGQNVCVFAYGQTGSGKTFTMSNSHNGMIKLSIEKIFNNIQDLKKHGWEYQLNGKFIEIYNESIIDLLNPDDETKKLKHEIIHDDINFKTTITNITNYPLNSSQQANLLFDQANKNRSTAATRINERSSRSHSVFIVEIKGRNLNTGVEINSVLNLIDLAGSERLNVSKVEGERMKETQAINKSLSCLGDVIYSLHAKMGHKPFRNSKLTYLLKNSLSGNSKTLMFVNISPLKKNFNETLNSLRFATKVNNTKI